MSFTSQDCSAIQYNTFAFLQRGGTEVPTTWLGLLHIYYTMFKLTALNCLLFMWAKLHTPHMHPCQSQISASHSCQPSWVVWKSKHPYNTWITVSVPVTAIITGIGQKMPLWVPSNSKGRRVTRNFMNLFSWNTQGSLQWERSGKSLSRPILEIGYRMGHNLSNRKQNGTQSHMNMIKTWYLLLHKHTHTHTHTHTHASALLHSGMRIFRGSAEFRDFYFKFIVFEISFCATHTALSAYGTHYIFSSKNKFSYSHACSLSHSPSSFCPSFPLSASFKFAPSLLSSPSPPFTFPVVWSNLKTEAHPFINPVHQVHLQVWFHSVT